MSTSCEMKYERAMTGGRVGPGSNRGKGTTEFAKKKFVRLLIFLFSGETSRLNGDSLDDHRERDEVRNLSVSLIPLTAASNQDAASRAS